MFILILINDFLTTLYYFYIIINEYSLYLKTMNITIFITFFIYKIIGKFTR